MTESHVGTTRKSERAQRLPPETITTKCFSLSRSEYCRLLLMQHFRRTAFGYVLLFSIAVSGVLLAERSLVIYGIVVPIVSASYRAIALYRNARDPDNRGLFVRRRIQLTREAMIVQDHDGGEAKIPLARIVRVVPGKDHYRLYTGKNRFQYVSFRAFDSDEERHAFERLLTRFGDGSRSGESPTS